MHRDAGVMTTIGLAPKLNILLKLGTNNSPAVTGDHIVKISVMGDRSKVPAFLFPMYLWLGWQAVITCQLSQQHSSAGGSGARKTITTPRSQYTAK